MHTSETFTVAALRFDNANSLWGDFQQSEIKTRLFRAGSRVHLEVAGFDKQDILAGTALPSDDQKAAVAELAYSIWDAIDDSDIPPLHITEARALGVTRQQIGGMMLRDLWPFMEDHTPHIEDIVEMRGVLLGDQVFVEDFMP